MNMQHAHGNKLRMEWLCGTWYGVTKSHHGKHMYIYVRVDHQPNKIEN